MEIGIDFYAFALFIAGLLCLIAILCKVLFANVKRQYKLLDEKETKLLQLYQTVESIMEEFSDQIKAATEEIKEFELRTAARAAAAILPPEPLKREVLEKLPRAERVDSSRMRAANDVLARAERIVKSDALKNGAHPPNGDGGTVFHRLFDETVGEAPEGAAETPNKQERTEAILALAGEGKTDAQIAQELGITQNEVKLVIGLKRK